MSALRRTPTTGADQTDGYEQRCRELETLRGDCRRELSERLREARHDGDLDDNPTFVDLLEEQVQLDQRIAALEGQLTVAEIAAPCRRPGGHR